MKDDKLLSGELYHIYNCGINGMDLFRESENYEHFLSLMDKFILPVAEIFPWVLMQNHFHLLVRIKIPNPNLHFSHLFNAYSKYFNKRYTRQGVLSKRRFKRKHIDNERY